MRIVQLLNWKLKSIEGILDEIKNQGFDAIQINPMQTFKHDKHFHWWLSYQPLGFELGNMYGTEKDLYDLCTKAKEKNIDIIVDIICNHTANKTDENPLFPHETVDQELVNNKNAWKPQKFLTDGDNRKSAVTELIGLPGLNLKDIMVQKKIFQYITLLKKCQVKGLRFDAAKHIGLPSDDVRFFADIKRYLTKYNMYGYGEFLGGDLEWRDEFATYLDVLTNYSNPISDIKKHVGYIESHDTYLHNDAYTTRNLKTNELNDLYGLLTYKFDKTLYYVRPQKFPYLPDGERINDFGVDFQELNELDYFDTSFLCSESVKKANDNSKVLVKTI